MKTLLLVAVVAAFAVAPALATLPTADACQPYTYYCALNGQSYYACGTKLPPPGVACVVDTVEGLILP